MCRLWADGYWQAALWQIWTWAVSADPVHLGEEISAHVLAGGTPFYTTISSELYCACNLSQPPDCRAEFHGGRCHGVKRAERNSGCLVFPYLLECIKHNTNYMSSPAFSNRLSSSVNEILLCRFSFKHSVVHYKSLGGGFQLNAVLLMFLFIKENVTWNIKH